MSGRTAALPTIAGLAGASIVGVSALATAFAYRGSKGQPYSPLSHWVSELGEEGVSELAPVFNAGVVVGGACLSVLMLSLAGVRGGPLVRAYGPLGGVAGLAGSLVGFFPMNRILLHAITSTT